MHITQKNPFGTVNQRSDEEKDLIRNQGIPLLTDLLDIAVHHDKNVMFDMVFGCGYGHPYANTFRDIVVDTILNHNIPSEKVSWIHLFTVSLFYAIGCICFHSNEPTLTVLKYMSLKQ